MSFKRESEICARRFVFFEPMQSGWLTVVQAKHVISSKVFFHKNVACVSVCVCVFVWGRFFLFSPLPETRKKKCRWLWNAVSCRWWIHFAFLCVLWTIAQLKRFSDVRFAEPRQRNRFRYYFHSSALISRIKATHKIYGVKVAFQMFLLVFFFLFSIFLFFFVRSFSLALFFCVLTIIYLSIHFSFGLFLEKKQNEFLIRTGFSPLPPTLENTRKKTAQRRKRTRGESQQIIEQSLVKCSDDDASRSARAHCSHAKPENEDTRNWF